MRRFLQRVLNLLRVRQPEQDFAREIDAHLALLQDTFEARGLSPAAAKRAARLTLGNLEQIKEQHRDARSFRWIEEAWQDAAHGLRLLRRSPAFTATAALSLAIGMAANTAIFAIANGLLLRPPAGIANPSELVVIGTARGDGGVNPLNYAVYLEIARRATSMTGVFAEELFPHVVGMAPQETGVTEAMLGRFVSTNFFRVLGSSAFLGRTFNDGDQAMAILDYGYWKRRFNGDAALIGRGLRINGRSVTVAGVAAPGFRGTGIQRCDAWLAIGSHDTTPGMVIAGGRVRPDASFDTAVAELRAIGEATDREQGEAINRMRPLSALPFSLAGENRNLVFGFSAALMVLVSIVLSVAGANVGGILLTRASARGREIAVRAALGASRGRLARQLLTETIVLFILGGVLGIVLAPALTRLALRMLPPIATAIVVPLALDWHVLLFALGLSVGAAVVFGVLPALRGSDVDVRASLSDGGQSCSGRMRLRSVFLVGQIACSVLLVVLGASFVRILRQSGAADPGFEARDVDLATLDLSVTGEPKAAPGVLWRAMIDRVRQIPAVEAASLARVPPGGWEGIGLGGVAPTDQRGSPQTFAAGWNIVESGYFATLRIPLVEGRDFRANDTAGTAPVVILSEVLARRLWPRESPIGKSLRLQPVGPDGRPELRVATVIGVVSDIRSTSLVDGLAEPYAYLPLAQSDGLGMTEQMSIVARRRGHASLAPMIAAVAQEIDPRLVLARTESLADAIALGLTPQRILAGMSSAMGVVALLLASIGIYGLTSYTVALRRRELAIRLALGASPVGVIRMVCRQGAWLIAAGLGIGLVLAFGAGHVLSVVFYGLPAVHLPTLAGTIALFIAIGVAASILPAGQAVREGWRRALQDG